MKASWSIFRRALFVGTLSMAIAAADTASACAIPVFRYALERWAPGVFEVAVLHRGALGEADQQCVDRLRAALSDQAKPANLRVITVDLDQRPDRRVQRASPCRTTRPPLPPPHCRRVDRLSRRNSPRDSRT